MHRAKSVAQSDDIRGQSSEDRGRKTDYWNSKVGIWNAAFDELRRDKVGIREHRAKRMAHRVQKTDN